MTDLRSSSFKELRLLMADSSMASRLPLLNSMVSTVLSFTKANDPMEAKLFPEKHFFKIILLSRNYRV